MDAKSKEDSSKAPSTDEDILALAKKELLRDIKCASLRAEQFGAHSWAKPQNYVPSKRFLKHLLVNTSRHNDRKEYITEERRKHARKTFDSVETSHHSKRDRSEKRVVKRSEKDLYSIKRKSEEDLFSKERKSEKDLYHSRERKSEKDLYSKQRKKAKKER